jgi:hypothetical protein
MADTQEGACDNDAFKVSIPQSVLSRWTEKQSQGEGR